MSTIRSITYATQVTAATNYAAITLDRTTVDAPVKIAAIDLDLTDEDVANTVIDIFQLPPGAVVFPTLSSIVVDDAAGATALTVDIGDIVDPDRYADGASALALGMVQFCHGTTVPDAVINPHKVEATGVAATDTSIVKLKIATSTTPAVGHFTVFLAYTCL